MTTQDCHWCKKTFRRSVPGKFCSLACQGEYRTAQLTEDWLAGKHCGYYGGNMQIAPFVKQHLIKVRGGSCEHCGFDKLHPTDNRHILQVDHIDGDASNCGYDNLRLLCPNCHAMTPTFGARNKKSARIR